MFSEQFEASIFSQVELCFDGEVSKNNCGSQKICYYQTTKHDLKKRQEKRQKRFR